MLAVAVIWPTAWARGQPLFSAVIEIQSTYCQVHRDDSMVEATVALTSSELKSRENV